jgi:hypothetical protein
MPGQFYLLSAAQRDQALSQFWGPHTTNYNWITALGVLEAHETLYQITVKLSLGCKRPIKV